MAVAPRNRRKNSRPRADDLPAPAWVDDPDLPPNSGMRQRRHLINHEARVPTYAVDRLIPDLIRKGVIFKVDDPIPSARRWVDISGAQAIEGARNQLLGVPKARRSALELIKVFEDLRRTIKKISRIDVDAAAMWVADERNVLDSDELKRPRDAYFFSLEEIDQIKTELEDIDVKVEALMNRMDAASHSVPPNQDPLTTCWMESAAWAWHALTGKWPDKASRRYFVRFLAAGWVDLGFPDEDANGEPRVLETWFGERLSKQGKLLAQNS